MNGPASEARECELLSGVVKRLTLHSPGSGCGLLRVKVRSHRDLVTVLGSAAGIHAGEHIQASGHWEQHRDMAECLQRTSPWCR